MSEAASTTIGNRVNHPQSGELPRRTRACEACRRQKAQCIYSSQCPEACDRCIKNHRPCVPAYRKTRNKVPASVAALERKVRTLMLEIDGLKEAQKGGQRPDSNDNGDYQPPERSLESEEQQVAEETQKAQHPGSNADYHSTEESLEPEVWQFDASSVPLTRPPDVTSGMLSPHHIEEAFEHFKTNVLVRFPILVLPPSLTASELRSEKPVLFLAILNAASGILPQEIQGMVNKQLDRAFAHHILVKGQNSLELVQALLVASAWYYAPPNHQGYKHNQLVCHNLGKPWGVSLTRTTQDPLCRYNGH